MNLAVSSEQKNLSTMFFITAGFVFLMVVLGGITRLTGSGLSMVDWKPITGFLPPLNETQWNAVFELYKTSPEYKQVNFGMTVNDFKGIFWLQFIHRLVGRMIGIIFLIPIIYSFIKPSLGRWRVRLMMIMILGGAQGVMGWYMVKSGLVNDPHVSHYRLCAHLLLAFLTYSILLVSGMQLRYNQSGLLHKILNPLNFSVLFLVILTISYGAFVAGTKAGLIYNTFPLMGDSLIPEEFLFHSPWHKDFLTNPVTIQFTHRVLAILSFFMVMVYILQRRNSAKNPEQLWLLALVICILAQVTLGIVTLILEVPTVLAVIHQGFALVLLSALLKSISLHRVKSANLTPVLATP